ncbi:MAG: hypothetical protein ABIJ61_11645 [bacterium]
MAIAAILLLLWGATSVATTQFSPIEKLPQELQESMTAPVFDIDAHSYSYELRVYVVEDSSRWKDDTNRPYDFGFLAFAVDQDVELTYTDTFTTSAVFDGSQYGYGTIVEPNISVIAVVFDSEWSWANAYPGHSGYQFQSHRVQTSAKAKSGETGYDNHSGGYSHTVFIEEGTATW